MNAVSGNTGPGPDEPSGSQQSQHAIQSNRLVGLYAHSARTAELLRTVIIIACGLFLVVIVHQGLVFMAAPVDPVHYWVHYAMLLIPMFLIIAIAAVWGSHRVISNELTIMGQGYQFLERAIDARSRMLAEKESMWLSLFNAFQERVLVINLEDRIVSANNCARRQIGRDPCGSHFSEIFHQCNHPIERRSELGLIHRTFQEKAPQRSRLLRGGEECALVLSIDTYPVFGPDGQAEMVIEIARDITRQSELEIRQRHQEKMVALGTLAAGFAHDLGNPLASLLSELDLSRKEQDIGRLHDSLETLRTHVERISRSLRDIMSFARKRSTRALHVSLEHTASDALRLIGYDPRARKINIQQHFQDRLPSVLINEDDLVLVFVNLLLNAFDAMPNGGDLTITGDMVESGFIRLRIRDTGIGMDQTLLKDVVKPLYTTKEEHGGTGLGLPLCLSIVRSAGGQLEIQSDPGHGTEVTILFPDTTQVKGSNGNG